MKHMHKTIFTTLALVALLSLSFFLGGAVMSRRSESGAVALAKEKLEKRSNKEIVSESDEFRQNSRALAQKLLSQNSEAPLLDDNPEGDTECLSLESIINDVNAGSSAGEAILDVCKKSNLDAAAARVKDLTEEQIMEIDQKVFCDSDHPM